MKKTNIEQWIDGTCNNFVIDGNYENKNSYHKMKKERSIIKKEINVLQY